MPTNTVIGSSRATFTITLALAATEEVRVDWATKDGTALAGRDYEANSGTVTFAPGETSKTIQVFVHGRTVETEDRVFYVLLDPPVNALLADEIGACVIHVDATGTVPVVTVIIPRGEKGLTGDSAYQIALNNGFVGTQPEWLASLRPSPEEIAPLVAPLINAGQMVVTAAQTAALPDSASIAAFAGRIAHLPTTKKAIAAPLTVGTNVIPMAAFAGDALNPENLSGFNVVIRRGANYLALPWQYLADSNEIKIDSAVAGDIPIAVERHIGGSDITNARVTLNGLTKKLKAWFADVYQLVADFKVVNDPAKGSALVGDINGTVYDSLRDVEAGVAAISAPGFPDQQNDFSVLTAMDDIGNVDTLNDAILSGEVVIAVGGDSILEGNSQTVYEDSAIGMLRRTLLQQNPNLKITVVNYSIAGLDITTLANLNYKGMAPPADPFVGFYRAPGGEADNSWPTGSVIGKAWLDHIKDVAPDLFIIGHGANAVYNDSFLFANNMQLVIDFTKNWPKKPSIAIVSAALPSKDSAIGAPLQEAIQNAADAARGKARENNCTLIDVNRRYLMMRDAIDILNKKYDVENGFGGYPAGWTPAAGASYAFTSPGVLSGTGRITRDVESEDIHMWATFVLPDYAAGVPAIFYRQTVSTRRYVLQLVNGNSLQLYFNTSKIGEKNLGVTVPNGTDVKLEIRCEGHKHMAYLNGIYMFTVNDYIMLRPGKHGVLITGVSGAVPLIGARLGNRYKVGIPQMTDEDIYGVNDWGANPHSEGGNGINHHAKKGGINVWGVAFTPLLHHFKRIQESRWASSVRASSKNTTTPFDENSGQQVSVRINTVEGPKSAVIGVSASVAMATAMTCQRIQSDGVQNTVVDVFLTVSGLHLSTNVLLPKGFWQVSATCYLTRNASGYLNSLSIQAFRTL